jgi:hypothetical protein
MGCLLSRQGEAGGVAGVPATPPPARLALPFIDAMDSGKLCMPILGKYFRLLQQRFYSLPNRVMNTVCSKFAFEMVAFAVVAWRCGCGTRETPTSRPATPNYPCSISTASESTGGQTWAFFKFFGSEFLGVQSDPLRLLLELFQRGESPVRHTGGTFCPHKRRRRQNWTSFSALNTSKPTDVVNLGTRLGEQATRPPRG